MQIINISPNCFSLLQTLISTDLPWSPPCLFCVSRIQPKRNYCFTRSTRPTTEHKRTAICKSQLDAIIENPGNTWGADQAFGRCFADRLYVSQYKYRDITNDTTHNIQLTGKEKLQKISLHCRRTKPRYTCMYMYRIVNCIIAALFIRHPGYLINFQNVGFPLFCFFMFAREM